MDAPGVVGGLSGVSLLFDGHGGIVDYRIDSRRCCNCSATLGCYFDVDDSSSPLLEITKCGVELLGVFLLAEASRCTGAC